MGPSPASSLSAKAAAVSRIIAAVGSSRPSCTARVCCQKGDARNNRNDISACLLYPDTSGSKDLFPRKQVNSSRPGRQQNKEKRGDKRLSQCRLFQRSERFLFLSPAESF